jgi:hypothetical protein
VSKLNNGDFRNPEQDQLKNELRLIISGPAQDEQEMFPAINEDLPIQFRKTKPLGTSPHVENVTSNCLNVTSLSNGPVTPPYLSPPYILDRGQSEGHNYFKSMHLHSMFLLPFWGDRRKKIRLYRTDVPIYFRAHIFH